MTETVFTNARIVLADDIVDGAVAVRDGVITDIARTSSALSSALDLEGDLLIPGLVELHTDNLESHLTPRPKTTWPTMAAVVSHDRQVAAAGITTVFDSIALGAMVDDDPRVERLSDVVEALDAGVASDLLQADHILHLRCEVAYAGMADLFDRLIDSPLVKLVSVMDHTPGQRQFADENEYRKYYQGKFGLKAEEMDAFIARRLKDQQENSEQNRRYAVEQAKSRGISLASHDDATHEHVQEAVEDGMAIAEFPTTAVAAEASHAHGLGVLMGAPNVVRGGSHSGNVSARELAERGVLDILSSDYVPSSLMHSAFMLYELLEDYDLPRAIRLVTKTPAEAANLSDRGEIAPGRRADLVRVRHTPHHPLIRGVWREGHRVA
ncbi:MAG: alpha-D-ribose 1-methylphosphonate 5-triphosphate diphosphatase [Alphaproteobacteria bacterium]|nr:alpha-D-ribose 1-methylphosphonate 5-triphosphate diphosphatase [Alphaproteobacteria bacterium]